MREKDARSPVLINFSKSKPKIKNQHIQTKKKESNKKQGSKQGS
jgi:hypothetical protein